MKKLFFVFVSIMVLIFVSGCGGSSGAKTDGTCSNEGEYRCNGDVVQGCALGSWIVVVDCSETEQVCKETEAYGITAATCVDGEGGNGDSDDLNGNDSDVISPCNPNPCTNKSNSSGECKVEGETGYSCGCESGYEWRSIECRDIDECSDNTDNCDANADCKNTAGSFTCECRDGYDGNGVTCSDIDECLLGYDNCSQNAYCENIVGSFTCECNDGYEGDGVNCSDVDECELGTDGCIETADCANTIGSYTCECKEGYDGNGYFCNDIDECDLETDNCSDNATCTNTTGSFTCKCKTGYQGDGVTCGDINECDLETDNCSDHATCSNTTGSFNCACTQYFSGSGTECTFCNTDSMCGASCAACSETTPVCRDNGNYTSTCVECLVTDECEEGLECSEAGLCVAPPDVLFVVLDSSALTASETAVLTKLNSYDTIVTKVVNAGNSTFIQGSLAPAVIATEENALTKTVVDSLIENGRKVMLLKNSGTVMGGTWKTDGCCSQRKYLQ
ncbi:MAG TPA: calcium-binding EGF-like domain-containing protein, partial [bacterium]|nr:calcium-binding EGF-like domain-containing protein [bacterium]